MAELIEDDLALRLADALHDDLLEGLGGDAPELGGVNFLLLGVHTCGDGVPDSRRHLVLNECAREHARRALLEVNLKPQVIAHAVMLAVCRRHRGLNGRDKR